MSSGEGPMDRGTRRRGAAERGPGADVAGRRRIVETEHGPHAQREIPAGSSSRGRPTTPDVKPSDGPHVQREIKFPADTVEGELANGSIDHPLRRRRLSASQIHDVKDRG